MHDRSISCAFQPQVDMLGIHSRSRLCDMLVSILCMFRDRQTSHRQHHRMHHMCYVSMACTRDKVLVSEPPDIYALETSSYVFYFFRGVSRAPYFAVVRAPRVSSSAFPLPFAQDSMPPVTAFISPVYDSFRSVFCPFGRCL